MTETPTIGKDRAASRRSESSRVIPRVTIKPEPSRRPAAPAKVIAVSSNGPCAVTNV